MTTSSSRTESGATQGEAAFVPPPRRATTTLDRVGPFGVPLAGLVLIVVFSVFAQDFATLSNAQSILRESALPALVAVGLTIVLVLGDFDLSIAALAGFGTMLLSVLLANYGMPFFLALLIALAVSVGVGGLNGLIVSYFEINALVATLAVGSLLNGMEFAVSGSTEVSGGYPQWVLDFSRSDLGPIPTLVVVSAVLIVGLWIMLERTALGREMKAIGSNAEGARLAGIDVRRTRFIGFVLCATAAGVAGILYGGRQGLAYPLTGLNVLLPSFAAAFIGAAMFRLGEFNIPGTLVGILIATITSTGLTLMNVPSYATYLFQGGILLGALGFARAVGGQRR